ncbi:MAG: Uncharacterized protein G01um101419_581 [Parcubacteria group bacterium Gr01-1014_19]|nr:MAG: Uncharacterized protein G01um101419_581 [Parcubacteria group bacterium Gr01-1014_19]
MSHSHGEVIQEGKVVGFFEYDGTADVALSPIWDTRDEVDANWRIGLWTQCTCHQPSTDVLLFTEYGGGFYWPAKACLNCKAITNEYSPFESDRRKDGHPLKTKSPA